MDNDIKQRVRLAAFDWLSNQIKVHGDVIPRAILAKGYLKMSFLAGENYEKGSIDKSRIV